MSKPVRLRVVEFDVGAAEHLQELRLPPLPGGGPDRGLLFVCDDGVTAFMASDEDTDGIAYGVWSPALRQWRQVDVPACDIYYLHDIQLPGVDSRDFGYESQPGRWLDLGALQQAACATGRRLPLQLWIREPTGSDGPVWLCVPLDCGLDLSTGQLQIEPLAPLVLPEGVRPGRIQQLRNEDFVQRRSRDHLVLHEASGPPLLEPETGIVEDS